MKNHTYYILIICSIILSACNGEDEYLDNPIKGTIAYVNTVNGSSETIPYKEKNIDVFLTDSEDSTNETSYLIPVKTDSTGVFTFLFTPENAKRIYCKTKINGIDYFGNIAIPTDKTFKKNCKLILRPTIGKGLIVTLKDSVENIIPNIEVYLFTSPINLKNVSKTDAQYHAKTNIYGKAYFDSLPGGLIYYLYSENTISSVLFKSKDTVKLELNYSGRTNKDLTITPNGIKFTIKDALGNPLPNTTICIFDNSFYANTNSCTNSIDSKNTNSLGEAFFPNLDKGIKYYYYVNGIINGLIYTKNDTITLSPQINIEQKTINIPVTYNSTLKILALDKFNSPINNLNTYLFLNRTNSLYYPFVNPVTSKQTNPNGIVEYTGLLEGKYYIRVRDSINPGLIFTASDSILYNPRLPQVTDTLHVIN